MKFKSLFIRGFGIFDDSLPPEQRFFNFDGDDITVVLGKNERGKSTLMEALVSTIYGIPAVLRDLRKPWGQSRTYGANLEISVKGRNFLIERDFFTNDTVLSETGGNEKRVLFRGNANPGSRSGQSRFYRETLESLGFPSKDVMKQLCFVTGMEMESGISDEIRRLATGGGPVDYHRVISELIGEYFRITRENPWQPHDKNRPRELELLIQEREDLENRRTAALKENEKTLQADLDLDTLIPEIRQLQEKYEKLSFLAKGLREAIGLKNEEETLRGQLILLIRERDRLNRLTAEKEETARQAAELSAVFDGVGEPVDDLCHQLILVQDRLKDLKAQDDARRTETDQLQKQKERMERELYDNYPELSILPDNIEELLWDAKRHREEYAAGIAFYEEYCRNTDELIHRQRELGDFADCPGDYEKKLSDYAEVYRTSKARWDELQEKLNSRLEIEKLISEKWERVRKDYPGIETLPEDLIHRIRDYRTAEQHRQLKMAQLEKARSLHGEIKEKIRSPKNFIPPVLGLLAGLFIGLAFNGGSLLIPVIAAISGIMAGGFASWHRLSLLSAEEARQNQVIAPLTEEVEKPLPDHGIGENLLKIHTPEELAELQRDYNAAVSGIEKLGIRATAMEDTGTLRREMEKTAAARVKAREEASLGPNDDPAEVLERYRQYRIIDEKLKNRRDGLASRFPSTTGSRLHGETPQELQSLKQWLDEFDEKYSFVKGMPPFETIKDSFSEMIILKGRLKEQDSIIAHSRKLDPFGPPISECVNTEKILLQKLKPALSAFDGDPKKTGRKYTEYVQLKKTLESLEKESPSAEDRESLISRMTEASDRLTLINESFQQVLLKLPALTSMVKLSPTEADTKLAEISHELESLEYELLQKKERENLCRARLIEAALPSDDPLKLAEDIEGLNRRIQRLETMKEGYRIAVDTLRESVEQFQQVHRQQLEDRIRELFGPLTDNRYGPAELNQDFELVLKDAFHQPVPLNMLSSGARDQLYFSVRLSLAQALSDQVSIPFLLDDPFSSFDNSRLELARGILTNIAKNHQIILFSHNDAYGDWGSRVYRLDRPAPAMEQRQT